MTIEWQFPLHLPTYSGNCPARWDTNEYVGLEDGGHILLEDDSGALLTEIGVFIQPRMPIQAGVPQFSTPIDWTPPPVHTGV